MQYPRVKVNELEVHISLWLKYKKVYVEFPKKVSCIEM